MRLFKILLILGSTCTNTFAQDSKSVIKFADIIVTIQSLAPVDNEELRKSNNDKIEFTADLGETLESSIVTVQTEKYKDIEIYQAVETSVTIMDEGPHCDLINWKHFTSEWRKVKVLQQNTFQVTPYTNGEARNFPRVTMQEVAEAARQQCGENWAKHIRNTKSIYDYPCDVGVSRYFLKIKATEKVNGSQIEKTIIILIPMGC